MAAVLALARRENPHLHRLLLAGFSFGTYVQAQLRERLTEDEVHGMILVGPAVSRHDFPTVPADTLVIHGEEDEVIPLAAVMDSTPAPFADRRRSRNRAFFTAG